MTSTGVASLRLSSEGSVCASWPLSDFDELKVESGVSAVAVRPSVPAALPTALKLMRPTTIARPTRTDRRFLRSVRRVHMFTVMSPLPVLLPLDSAPRAPPFANCRRCDHLPPARQPRHLSRSAANVQL